MANKRVGRLSSGRNVRLRDPGVPGLAGRYWVVHVSGVVLDDAERDELTCMALAIARDLAEECFGDPECHSILVNGAATRRTGGDHVHIVLSGSLAEKRRHFLLMQGKHLTRRLRRVLRLGPLALSGQSPPRRTGPLSG